MPTVSCGCNYKHRPTDVDVLVCVCVCVVCSRSRYRRQLLHGPLVSYRRRQSSRISDSAAAAAASVSDDVITHVTSSSSSYRPHLGHWLTDIRYWWTKFCLLVCALQLPVTTQWSMRRLLLMYLFVCMQDNWKFVDRFGLNCHGR